MMDWSTISGFPSILSFRLFYRIVDIISQCFLCQSSPHALQAGFFLEVRSDFMSLEIKPTTATRTFHLSYHSMNNKGGNWGLQYVRTSKLVKFARSGLSLILLLPCCGSSFSFVVFSYFKLFEPSGDRTDIHIFSYCQYHQNLDHN